MPAQAKHHRGSHDDEGTVGDMPAYDSELFRISRYVHLAVVKTRDARAERPERRCRSACSRRPTPQDAPMKMA